MADKSPTTPEAKKAIEVFEKATKNFHPHFRAEGFDEMEWMLHTLHDYYDAIRADLRKL